MSEQCAKCGRKLDLTPHGPVVPSSVRKLAEDHAAKYGCDWPGANPEATLNLFVKKGK